LADDGILMIDFPNTPPTTGKENRQTVGPTPMETFYEFEVEGHFLTVHYISPEVTKMWANATGFKVISLYPYITDNGSWRTTAILRKVKH
jgi:hypothetical protein